MEDRALPRLAPGGGAGGRRADPDDPERGQAAAPERARAGSTWYTGRLRHGLRAHAPTWRTNLASSGSTSARRTRCVASVRNRIPKIVPTDRGNLILPSVVALSAKGDLLVGGVAKDQMVTNPKNTLYGTKRLIGRKYHSKVVQELKELLPLRHRRGPERRGGGDAGRQACYTLPQISSFVLAQVKTIAEQFLGGPIDEAVISVPAYYNDNQRQAVKEAGRLAGFDVKRIVNEPTAAALAYGFNRGLDQKILVYDLGGGTFDVSVLQLTGNVFEVLATGGDTFLGGVDFDNRIIDYVLEAFREETKVDLSQSPIAMQRIKNAAEAAKIDLTLIPNVRHRAAVHRGAQGQAARPAHPAHARAAQRAHRATWWTARSRSATEVLAEKGITRSDIDEIILVGGQSRMPLVQQKIQEHFGKPPRKGVHPDECVALGAALLADSLGSIDAVTLLDALSMPIGYALPNGRVPRSHREELAHPAGEELPAAAAEGAGRALHRDGHLPGRQRPDRGQRVPGHAAGAGGRRRGGRSTSGSTRSACSRWWWRTPRGREAVELATRDTPESLQEGAARRPPQRTQQAAPAAATPPAIGEGGGLFSSIKRIFRRG